MKVTKNQEPPVANLASFSFPETIRESAIVLDALRTLLSHIDKCETPQDQRIFRHLVDHTIGQFERVPDLAAKLDIDLLAWTTRNLFEGSIVIDYVCMSDSNLERLIGDYYIDDLEIWEKLTTIDKRAAEYIPHDDSVERMKRLEARIAQLGLTGKKPQSHLILAKATNREVEFSELNKIYSKLSHSTAWAILGGTAEPIKWEPFAFFLLLKAAGYALGSLLTISRKIGFSLPPEFIQFTADE